VHSFPSPSVRERACSPHSSTRRPPTPQSPSHQLIVVLILLLTSLPPSLLSAWHAVVSSPSSTTSISKGLLLPLRLIALLTQAITTVAAVGCDLLAKWEQTKARLEEHFHPPGSPNPCKGYWESFIIMCPLAIFGPSYVMVECYRSDNRRIQKIQKEDDPEDLIEATVEIELDQSVQVLVDTTLGTELDRSAQGVAAVKRQKAKAKKAFLAGVMCLLLELTIFSLICLAFLGVSAVFYCIGIWGVGAIVAVATLAARKEEGEQGVDSVIDFAKTKHADNKRKQRKQRALRHTFLARTCLAPMLGDHEEEISVDTCMAKRWARMGSDELIQDKGLIGSIWAGLLSEEAEGAAARSPFHSMVFEKLGETSVGVLLAQEAEGREAVAPFTTIKVIKQRWTLARILGITLPARRQRQASTSLPTTSSARASSQIGGDDFRSKSVLPRGAASSSINVDGAGVVVGEAWSVEGRVWLATRRALSARPSSVCSRSRAAAPPLSVPARRLCAWS